MGYKATRGKVVEYLLARKEEDVTLAAIMRATNLTKTQVQHQMNRLVNLEYPIRVIVRGQVWRYLEIIPTQEPEPEVRDTVVGSLWECIGVTKKGDPIMKDESGILYVAKELDV